ncbi:MAG: FkbM family methyltransferase, partial [Phycisphaeraceae bacterium]|nr:FkbM family methyltransferase [Phycisphaeraceae bacterium]
MKLRNAIQRLTNRHGYEIRKFPAVKYPRYPYFDLALATLLARAANDKLWFIQVGANDGNYGDPLRKWIQRPNFHGVVVEPQPNVFQRLKNNYKLLADRIICENSAVSRSAGSLELYRVPVSATANAQQVWESSIASTNPHVVARQAGLPVSRLEKVAIPCLTLDDLLNKHKLPALDLLQIDTEGH